MKQKFEEAVQTYEEDLKRLPKNGWALHRLKLAHMKLGNKEKVSEIEHRLTTVWATADVKLSTSVLH